MHRKGWDTSSRLARWAMIDSFWMNKASARLRGMPAAAWQGPDIKIQNQKPSDSSVSLLGEITERMLH